jgi:DNA-binding sugar fermentation-stimulating protein
VEVKNAHLMREAGLAEFPDSVTARGAKHLAELSKLVGTGARAVMLFLVQRGDAEAFALAYDLDPNYVRAFDAAADQGVEAMAVACFPSTGSCPRAPFLSSCGVKACGSCRHCTPAHFTLSHLGHAVQRA